ncbi:YbaN family protein [Otariodibacter sp.]|uniref:YbaN family protein n=1 Tax=Otariodibacter sp. TaxID=3030919 RepID=UPI002618F5B4|nr:YbaN family protein [Otariodibacter sp.]
MTLKKLIYILIAFLCLALGIIGIVVPGLPTTPFLLVALYCFGKSSDRLQAWFMTTKLYDKYLKEYDQNRAMTIRQKVGILAIATPFCIFALFVLPNIWGKIAIVIALIFEYYYFIFRIKTIKPLEN